VAARRQRIARVQHEVEDRLFDLRRIHFHCRRPIGQLAGQRDVLADETREHASQPGHGLIQVHILRHEDLFAAEGEQLLRQRRRPLSRFLDFLEIGAVGIRIGVMADEQLRVS
jgi:hypothetical protein